MIHTGAVPTRRVALRVLVALVLTLAGLSAVAPVTSAAEIGTQHVTSVDAAGTNLVAASSSRQQEREHRLVTESEVSYATSVALFLVILVVGLVAARPTGRCVTRRADRAPPALVLG